MNNRHFLIYLVAIISTCISGNLWGQSKKPDKPFAIVIHGGAGVIENLSPSAEKDYREKLSESVQAGYAVLEKGGTSLQAVEAAISVLEDSPLFNAGKGSVLTAKGSIEMDASVMNGQDLKAGAVTGVKTIKNPIKAAIAVLEQSPHVMLSGKGADEFGKQIGLAIEDTSYFHTEIRQKQLEKIRNDNKNQPQTDTTGNRKYDQWADEKWGTVGAVALDQYGNIAAGTSTGGMANKRFGRIGDSPVIGAGTYADSNVAGVSCTGHGEFFIRYVVAYDLVALMKYKNLKITDAAAEIIQKKLRSVNGEGGLIALDKQGNIAMSFNTTGMFRGYAKSSGDRQILIYKE